MSPRAREDVAYRFSPAWRRRYARRCSQKRWEKIAADRGLMPGTVALACLLGIAMWAAILVGIAYAVAGAMR